MNQNRSIVAVMEDLKGLERVTDPAQVLKLSQDYFHFSPILFSQLAQKRGDLVIRPRTEAEVVQVVQACVAHRVPLTVRGAGTGNYGQCIPLHGGVILDLSLLNRVADVRPGVAVAEAGVKLAALDKLTREQGWELRMVPSTYRTATIAGFISGGSGGIGSINYGFLADRGNVQGATIVTMEDSPRILALRGDELRSVIHAYGTTGIITQLEMPLAPAHPWAEVIVGFENFKTAAAFCQALAESDGLVKKLVCLCASPIASYFAPFKTIVLAQESVALLLIAESSLENFQDLVNEYKGRICYQKSAVEAAKGLTLMEYSWNHTTLHARSVDPQITYLQTLFPSDRSLALLHQCYEHFGEEVMIHAEWIRNQGQITIAGLQLVRYSTPDRLQEIMDYHEDQGVLIFNPHTYVLEDGGRKIVDPVQLERKQQTDPYGLLNPGKMRSYSVS